MHTYKFRAGGGALRASFFLCTHTQSHCQRQIPSTFGQRLPTMNLLEVLSNVVKAIRDLLVKSRGDSQNMANSQSTSFLLVKSPLYINFMHNFFGAWHSCTAWKLCKQANFIAHYALSTSHVAKATFSIAAKI